MRSYASVAVDLNSSVISVITQRRLVEHRRFGKTYRSHLQVSSVQEEPIGCSEPTLRNNPEDGRIQGIRYLLQFSGYFLVS